MDPELRRRLDALLLLASVIVGAEVADLFAASGNDLVLFAAIPTVLAAVTGSGRRPPRTPAVTDR
jgi:hypothetical protein